MGRCFSRPTNSRKSKVYQLGAGFKVFGGTFHFSKKSWRRFKPGILTNICFVTGLKLNRSNLVQVSYNQILKNSGVFCVVYQGHQHPMIYHHVYYQTNLRGFPIFCTYLCSNPWQKPTQSISFTTGLTFFRRKVWWKSLCTWLYWARRGRKCRNCILHRNKKAQRWDA